MANNKIKVVGYAKKQIFNGNIEYRNFSDDLVGSQLTSQSATFTFGNFAVTTNLDAKPSKIFTTNRFSNFVSLCDIDLSVEESEVLLLNNGEIKLKLDKSNLCNYAYFGSMLEYVRVSLENIITTFPASIYINPIVGNSATNLTIEDYLYNILNDETSFRVNTDVIRNNYQLNYLKNGEIINLFNEDNDLRNITVNFLNYTILYNDTEYPVLEFTGATSTSNDYIYLNVKGNPFSGVTGTTDILDYHIKPKKLKEESFYNNLPDFENNLLNRLTSPKYSSVYKYPTQNDSGTILFQTEKLTWPVTDGYNIDFETTKYVEFARSLIKIATAFDENKTNLMVRFFTAEAISDFDTIQNCDGGIIESESQRMAKTLKIYGREYDEIKRYIDGIQYANTVTYNQLDNTPDTILKYLAMTLGWGLVSSVLENDLLANYVTSTDSSYSGMSRGYTAAEAEVEMWRRIILNTPWIWKSKGARKSIEFIFKFIGAPDGLINFNEFIYLAKSKIDVTQFKELLEAHELSTDLFDYNVDDDGYPRVFNNNSDMYFQKGGHWYRQTGGSEATIDILTGNNPHIGPYDGGAAFINQFNCLIPDFSATTLSSTTETTDSTNLFTNYESGTVNSYSGDYYVDVVSEDGVNLEDCVVITTTKVIDPFPTASELTDCGCEIDEDDYALLIDVACGLKEVTIDCSGKLGGQVIIDPVHGWMTFTYNSFDNDGNLLPQTYTSNYASVECCNSYGGTPLFHEDFGSLTATSPSSLLTTPRLVLNCGYVCCSTDICGCGVTCDWDLVNNDLGDLPIIQPYNQPFLVFKKPNDVQTSVVPTACSCLVKYTVAVPNITDPITGEVGYGCMLTKEGTAKYNGGNKLYYYLSDNGDGTYSVSTFNQTNPPSNLPAGATTNILQLIYSGVANGLLPCNNQYMNINGLEYNDIISNNDVL